MKTLRKMLVVLLAVLMLAGSVVPVSADEDIADTNYVDQTYNYLYYERDEQLKDDRYYSYEQFVDNVDNGGGLWDMSQQMAETTLDLDYEPDTNDYVSGLSNILALTVDPSLSSLNTLSEQDDLNDGSDYAMDLMDLGMDVVGDFLGSKDQDVASKVTDIVNNFVASGESAAENIVYVEQMNQIVLQYAAYDQLLAQIEANSDGELKEAAAAMRNAGDAVFEYTVNNFVEFTMEGLVDHSMTFLDFFTEDTIQSLAEDGLDAGVLSTLNEAYGKFQVVQDLVQIGGDVILNAEDAAYRTREMRVLSDIADAASDALEDLEDDYMDLYSKDKATRSDAKECVDMSQFLLMTRRRGEYCLYNLIREDSGVLSLLFGGDDEVDAWYRKVTEYLNNESWKIAYIWADLEFLTVNRYQLFNGEAATWEDAAAYCESLGGHLVTIGSPAENNWVHYLMKQAGYESAYIGLKETSEGVWEWVNGEPVIYLNWGGREPNDEGGDENYAMFYFKYSDGQWNDGDFGKSTVGGGRAFICEWTE